MSLWLFPALFVLLPIVLTVLVRRIALRRGEPSQYWIWSTYQSCAALINTTEVAGWWVIWSLPIGSQLALSLTKISHGMLNESAARSFLFWIPPALSLNIYLMTYNASENRVLRLKWTAMQAVRQASWKFFYLVIPLIVVAASYDDILAGRPRGFFWFIPAGIISWLGRIRLNAALGYKLRRADSGELRNRAIRIASKMGSPIRKVYLFPEGKNHYLQTTDLLNAIGFTDNLGKYLSAPQLDYAIACEVAHLMRKHRRKKFLVLIAAYYLVALLLFLIPVSRMTYRPVVQVASLLTPIIALRYFSRSCEYDADKIAVEYTGDPESAIVALSKLYRRDEGRAAQYKLAELFAAHPTFENRALHIARRGHISSQQLAGILEKSGRTFSAAQFN